MVLTDRLDRVESTIRRHELLSPSDRVLAAFSGGADSTALALVLVRLGYEVVLGHVDHQMRPSSRKDAERSMQIAQEIGLPFAETAVEVDPPTEAEARKVRYAALERMADEARAARIATGHTLDDQAETVLMRLSRGGFPFGIPPKRGRIVRPLLDLRRSETEKICAEAGIEFLVDETNLDTSFLRNRIRIELMPLLEDETILALGALAEEAWLRSQRSDKAIDEAVASGVLKFGEEAEISRGWLSTASPEIARRAIVRAIEHLGIEPSYRLVEDIENKVVGRTGSGLDLGRGFEVWDEPEALFFGRAPDGERLPEIPLRVPGLTSSEEWGLTIESSEISGSEALERAASARKENAFLDLDSLPGPLYLRSRRAGDRFKPLGGGTKKLQDFLVDEKVPRRARDRVPLVVDGDEIVWVVGHRIADPFKVKDSTRRALRIKVTPGVARGAGRP